MFFEGFSPVFFCELNSYTESNALSYSYIYPFKSIAMSFAAFNTELILFSGAADANRMFTGIRLYKGCMKLCHHLCRIMHNMHLSKDGSTA